jgi:CHAT domain-containing protein
LDRDKILFLNEMIALREVADPRVRRRLASGTLVLFLSIVCLRAARPRQVETSRPFDGRLFATTAYQPPGRLADAPRYLAVAADSIRTDGRRAGAALLFAGRSDDAMTLLVNALLRSTKEGDTLAAIHRSHDVALLTDYTAAALAEATATGDAKLLLLAYEAADRNVRLQRTPQALWNRALAIDRLGFPALAARAWRDAAIHSDDARWSREADERRRAAERRASAPPPASEELFFQQELIARAAAIAERSGSIEALQDAARRREVASGDHMAGDTAESLRRLLHDGTDAHRLQLISALRDFARGRAAVEDDRLADGLEAFRSAEHGFDAVRSPLALLARDQRIRCQCGLRDPSCLALFRALHAEIERIGRYPWLTARSVYAIGQTLYRGGRIYEAAESFRAAQMGLHRTNDAAGEALMHSLLANVLAMAGETDLALQHYLTAIRLPAPPIGDRRRRQLGDLTVFLLRHGFISTTELLLDEIDRWPTTDEGRVEAATLRGVIQARRGNAAAATAEFRRAHMLGARVADATVRAEALNALAVAEAGVRRYAPAATLSDLDTAIARHEKFDHSAMLPQLLLERGALLEMRGERERAKNDYFRAMVQLELRGPRVDEMLMGFGIDAGVDSPFDRAIALLLEDGQLAEALNVADRSIALRISTLYARSAGLRDPFRQRRESLNGDPLAAARAILRQDQTFVFQYLLPGELVSWIVLPSRVEVVRRRVGAAQLITHVSNLVNHRDSRTADDLSDLLLRGWIDRITPGSTIVIVPPPDLKSVPYPMLTTAARQPLITRNAVVTEPSLRGWVAAIRADAARTHAVVPFFAAAPRPGGERPPLPLAEEEVRLVSRVYPNAVVDAAATRARFLERAPSFAIIHFAGHAVVNPQQPLLSALVFQPGEPQLLYVHELDGRSFRNARLVVLSGCETGVAPQPTMSIAHALLDQSVPSVVYTSWPVPDEAAKEFAIAFHRAIAAGASRAAALRDADLSLLRNHSDHPEWWAAFEISGADGPLVRERKGAIP